jgi:hypothetical protein
MRTVLGLMQEGSKSAPVADGQKGWKNLLELKLINL